MHKYTHTHTHTHTHTRTHTHRQLPGYLKDPQESYAAQDGNAKRGHDLCLHQDGLQDPPPHHKAVKAVEERHKVGLGGEETETLNEYRSHGR